MIEMVGVATGKVDGSQLVSCSLDCQAAEIHAVVGAAGSGKSLISEVVVGRRRPIRGVTKVMDLDSVSNAVAVRGLLTHVPVHGTLDGKLSMRQQLAWWLSLLEITPTPVDLRRALRESEIPDRLFDESAATVPSEFRILLWVALAQLRNQRILVIDDPVRTTSSAGSRHLIRVFQDLARSGWCLLLTTRDTRFAETVASSLTVLENGRTQLIRKSIPSAINTFGRSELL